MPMYRSPKAPAGKRWTGTQADAREAQGGKDFDIVELPKGKPEVIELLNASEAEVASVVPRELPQPHDGDDVQPVPETPLVTPAPDAEEASLPAQKVLKEPKDQWTGHPEADRIRRLQGDRLALEEVLWEAEAHTLDAIEGIIAERRAELSKPKPEEAPEPNPTPRPRARMRTRNPAAQNTQNEAQEA